MKKGYTIEDCRLEAFTIRDGLGHARVLVGDQPIASIEARTEYPSLEITKLEWTGEPAPEALSLALVRFLTESGLPVVRSPLVADDEPHPIWASLTTPGDLGVVKYKAVTREAPHAAVWFLATSADKMMKCIPDAKAFNLIRCGQ